jgi:hypothetical protein
MNGGTTFGKILDRLLKMFIKEDVFIEEDLILAEFLYPYNKSHKVFNGDQREANLHPSCVQGGLCHRLN